MPALSNRARAMRDLLHEAEQLQKSYVASQDDAQAAGWRAMDTDGPGSDDDAELRLPRPAADSDDEDEIYMRAMWMVESALDLVSNTRVLEPSSGVPKASQLPLVLEQFHSSEPKRFRRNLRVSPSTFDRLVSILQPDPVFTTDAPAHTPQLEVRVQLAITLYRLGHFGNVVSVEAVAQWAGVSAGAVFKSTQRVMLAVLCLHDEAIQWPSAAEKEQAKTWVESVSCAAWRDGFCMVDGTLVKLFEKPGWHGEAYFSRKMDYSLTVQIINLPNSLIIDYVVGHCGSAHNSTCFEDSRTCKESETLFGENEWIWADSAYATCKWCVTPYRKPAANLPENKTYNYHVSRVRVKSEHTMGLLKGRFCSLKDLRQQINNERAHHMALIWVKTCIVLHNIIMRIEDGNDDTEWLQELLDLGREDVPDDEEGMGEEEVNRGRMSAGQLKREGLKTHILAHIASV